MKQLFCTLTTLLSLNIFAQKKILDHSDFDIWNAIQKPVLSANGDFVMYALEQGEKESQIKIKDRKGNSIFRYERSRDGQFTYNGKWSIFKIEASPDSILEMKRRKLKKKDFPKDTLGIFNLSEQVLQKIAHIQSYKIPKKWSGYIAYTYDLPRNQSHKKEKRGVDTLKTKPKKGRKEPSTKNGYPLVIRNLATAQEDTIPFVTHYTFAKRAQVLAYSTTGLNTKVKAGVYVTDLKTRRTTCVFDSHHKATYFKLSLSDSGNNLGFIVDTDTMRAHRRPKELHTWNSSANRSVVVVNEQNAPAGYRVSSDGEVSFSEDETKLYFGLTLPEIVQDTTLLKEEIVNVEVWTYDEPRLYTVQEKQVENDRKKSFQTVYHLKDKKLVQIATREFPEARLPDRGNGDYALISTREPYQLRSQWTGQFSTNDLAVLNLNNGRITMAIKANPSTARLSPMGTYAYGYHQIDSTWYTYHLSTGTYTELTKGKKFYNELNDTPDHPRSYGLAGWTKNDKTLLIYDRYDLWEFAPDGTAIKRLTKGRETTTNYRAVQLDPDKRFVDLSEKILMRTFNEDSKNSGYFEYHYKKNKGTQLIDGPYHYSIPKKARMTDQLLFTRESFQEFPNLRVSNLSFDFQQVISDANPQQVEYNWGTSELVHWTSLDGIALTGILIKPENFDPNKKYPMIVNFYEKSSSRLHRHRAPNPGRSSINYSFYTSRGYLIFNPDVHYRIGYPGESAFNCVISGVTSLVEKGFIDKERIGVQGHSWGGYQIAYLVTKTTLFKAAESGAPVVNMVSAFGGIRWDTGLSRQFQYEHTQSRIGGTPWEYPQRYFENSPIYNIDKIHTPLLIMHNDADGHVPWYQGIEFFVSLRRLGKPSWLLNYNGARHWPLKMRNRKDFNIRMQQFFDHYLQGAPKPIWMVRGVPAIEKGINQGYELVKDN